MCDYSLMHVKSRPAAVGDRLTVHNFGSGTRGFKSADDAGFHDTATAVCVLPGTELAFDAPLQRGQPNGFGYLDFSNMAVQLKSAVAIFRQMDKDKPLMHHDALELYHDHKVEDTVLLNHLVEGQTATVLQLPAAPKNEAEAKDQERLAIVA